MCERQDEFDQTNTRVVVVSFGTLPAIQAWIEETCTHFEVLIDRDRKVYQAYQLERSFFRAWHPRVLWTYFKLWLQGNSFLDGHGDDTTQLGGDFIIDNQGILRMIYHSTDPTDRPMVDDLLAVIRRLD